MEQLSLFSRWALRNRRESTWWRNHNYKPQVGQLTQMGLSNLGFNLNMDFKPQNGYDPNRLYCVHGGSAQYLQAINLETEEAPTKRNFRLRRRPI